MLRASVLLEIALFPLNGEIWFCGWLFGFVELLKPDLLIAPSLGDNAVVKADAGGTVPQLPHLKGVFVLAGDV